MACRRRSAALDGENGRIANKVLKSLQSKTLWVTLACTTPKVLIDSCWRIAGRSTVAQGQ